MSLQIRPLWIVAGAAVGLGLAVMWVAVKDGKSTGEAIGTAAVDLAEGTVVGVVGGLGSVVGLPTPSQTTTDPAVARWIIDRHGYLTASKWASAPALFKGMWMKEGTGTPPPPGSPADKALGLSGPIDFGKGDGW